MWTLLGKPPELRLANESKRRSRAAFSFTAVQSKSSADSGPSLRKVPCFLVGKVPHFCLYEIV